MAHNITVGLFKLVLAIPIVSQIFKRLYNYKHPKLTSVIMGLSFPNRVGLAAGFDKNAEYYQAMQYLGFGFVEVGTVTPKPQNGNEQPRLFRLPKDEALINRMGFNNNGVAAMVAALKKRKKNSDLIIGANIGKNKVTPNASAVDDYLCCFEALFSYVDYFVVNVSSPNTPNLRALQDKEPLTHLLNTLQHANQQQPHPKPLLLKIAPDLNTHQIDDIISIALNCKLTGIVATNTTITRNTLRTKHQHTQQQGGLSGQPLRQMAIEKVRYIRQRVPSNFVIIGVGGIDSAETAQAMLKAGADLIQIYTGLVYKGPNLVKNINTELAQL